MGKIFIFFYFIISSLLLLGCTTTPLESKSVGAPLLRAFSILQGYTTDTATQLSVVVPKGKIFRYFVRAETAENAFELRDIDVQYHTRDYSDWAVHKIFVRGLEPNRSYTFEVRGPLGELLDARELRTVSLYKSRVRFAAASCLDDEYSVVQKKIWPELLAKNPDYIFLLGDNVYATKPRPLLGDVKPKQIWNRYVENRLRLDFYKASTLVPTLAIWDDHDYGQNDGDRNYTYKDEAREIFQIFFAQDSDHRNLEPGPGISYLFRAFQQNFYFLDNRSFRSPNRLKTDDQTHWGPAQERWLLEGLRLSSAPSWIINGDQIYGAYHRFESYEGSHPESFSEFQKNIAKIETPYIYLTGDRHLIEVMEVKNPTLGISTFEITTSGLHARLYSDQWVSDPNPRQINGRAGLYNYVIIESENIANNLHTRLTGYTINNEVLFHRYFEIRKGTGTNRTRTR